MPFADDTEVDVKELDDREWQLLRDIVYFGKMDTFLVPRTTTKTDFASVPRVFVWFLPRYGRYTKAAILHDYLWRERASKGTMDWIDADALFRRAMREDKVPFLRRWILWAAVRWGALVKPGGTKHWLRESWRVVLVSLAALPIVLPPAVVIIVALLVFLVIETVLYGILEATAMVKRAMGKPSPKEVNMPSLTWRL